MIGLSFRAKLTRPLYLQIARVFTYFHALFTTVECLLAHNVLMSRQSALLLNKLPQILDWVIDIICFYGRFSFTSWHGRKTNWLNILYIFLLYWAKRRRQGKMNRSTITSLKACGISDNEDGSERAKTLECEAEKERPSVIGGSALAFILHPWVCPRMTAGRRRTQALSQPANTK